MPTYEYKCKHCEHRFEAFQRITEAPLRRCPKCRKNGVQRLISPGAGIIFKGSGFYVTDYKRGSAASSAPKKETTRASTESGEKSPD